MKKFLSLLLALTLVLSLVVVPARAAEELTVSGFDVTLPDGASTTVENNTQVTVNAKEDGITVTEGSNPITGATATYKWSVNGVVESSVTGHQFQKELTTNNETTTVTITCEVTYTKDSKTGSASASKTFTVNNSEVQANNAFVTALSGSIAYAGRTYRPDADKKITAYKFTGDASGATWTVPSSLDGYDTITITTNPGQNDGSLTITGKTTDSKKTSVTATFTCKFEAATVSVASNPTDKEVIAGGTLTLTATCAAAPSDAKYLWYVDSATDPASNKTSSFTLPSNTAVGTHSVKCVVMASDGVTKIAETTVDNIKVITDTYTFTVVPASVTLTQIGQTATLAANFADTSTSPATPVTPTYSFVSANLNIATVANPETAAPTVTLRASGSTTVTAKATYKGKDYVQNIPVTGALIEATLSAVQNGTSVNYSYSDLVNAAQAAINKTYSTAYTYETVYSLSGVTQVASTAAYGVGKSNASYNYPAGGSGYLYFKANLSGIGTAKFTATVTTRVANSNVPKTYSVTFNVPVTPSSTTYADQYPEPVAAYGNTYRYYVQVPSGARYYYVAGVNTEPVDWNNGSTQKYYPTTATANLYSLTDTNFINGKCTLYVVTQGTDNKLYCGTISVYQKNYNINYNGVAGETVQFAQSDFNDFMNKVAEARGDASKSKSYPYVTFDYVSFSLPTTAQGTLYYGGTAMSTSNSSGAFNTRTKVTNLDSVTFVPNDKTTAKTITLNFTLYATRYSSSSTSRGTTVSYSGSVVVNLVREDIKYTVSQGDSVRFDESDFLSYLSSTKGYSSNYTIDYVTFDQSAVSAVSEGSLYTYYSGYNYGGSVKTTDKFYYSATASQNALSDVAFLASRYAKTGETVYIPFTIYARYGTTGTGTRQLTGTVAIKIGQTMNFIDVKTTDYFYNSVKWAVGKNITNGTSSTTFSPYKSCTRAEIVTFLWRAAGSPEPTTTRNPFRDVNAVTHSSYYKAILWASQKGITSGTSTTAFSPDQVCTRAQIVTFLYRYAGQPSGYYSNPFKDVGATSEASYYKAILWAIGKGITTGTSATTFSPYASCNRAEAVTFLYRYTNGL